MITIPIAAGGHSLCEVPGGCRDGDIGLFEVGANKCLRAGDVAAIIIETVVILDFNP